MTEVTKKTAHLSWKAPEDDGGRQIQTYEVEKLDPVMDQWLPAGKTKGTSVDIKVAIQLHFNHKKIHRRSL